MPWWQQQVDRTGTGEIEFIFAYLSTYYSLHFEVAEWSMIILLLIIIMNTITVFTNRNLFHADNKI